MAVKAARAVHDRVSRNGIEGIVFERQAQICKAFASPVRLQILDILGSGECGASKLQEALDVSKANLSQHISVLRHAGVVSTRREGQQVFCSLTFPEVKQACQLIKRVLCAQIEGERKLLI